MSLKDDPENDIWEYKPLKKKRKAGDNSAAGITRKCTSKPYKRGTRSRGGTAGPQQIASCSTEQKIQEHESLETLSPHSPVNETLSKKDNESFQGSSPEEFCPICQMPFSALVVQSQRWHVSECLEIDLDHCKECPDGLQCCSTIPNHYKKHSHTLLAHSRATGISTVLSLSQHAGTNLCPPPELPQSGDKFSLENSQENSVSLSNCSASSANNDSKTPSGIVQNSLLQLRSPGPEDMKKKKGWSPFSKGQKSGRLSQESKTELSSTPVKPDNRGQICESANCPDNDEYISFSPLSENLAESEAVHAKARKFLFTTSKHKNSSGLFSDNLSSEDDLFNEFIDNFEDDDLPKELSSPSSTSQLVLSASLAPRNQFVGNTAAPTIEKEAHTQSSSPNNIIAQSQQSLVLLQLRETLKSQDLNNSTAHLEYQQLATYQAISSEFSQRSQTMAPCKGQGTTGQGSCLKQVDIGVYFGLKPLKELEKEKGPESGVSKVRATSSQTVNGKFQPKRQREHRRRLDTTDPHNANTSKGITLVNEGGGAGGTQAKSERGGNRGWKRGRWRRQTADGEEEEKPRCPFYKKIPGTKFVVDAFHYGNIEGITAYFLTHFHSDHYGGLTKKSTVPIYCNKITGNLVKSKLKVAEQHVHILPMNTQVTVDGVRVTLLEANHCPGAAMLLLVLPDGQTVLHTGDFRADPSMESYPELLTCRVQTLYLDTTYCNPQYTFPKQQEVINFAATTAFEAVTNNPRTLVVCGSYSVGKERVFLALADILGSKVCLSRDKYNTMCCLESEQVKKLITTDWKAARVHVLPMMQLTFKKLQDHLSRFSRQYNQLLAFKPTGWTFSQQVEAVGDIQPEISGNVVMYGIPYSEHSSFLELKRFVQWLRPLKIIPTVNNGSWSSRKSMEKCFSEWLAESKIAQ